MPNWSLPRRREILQWLHPKDDEKNLICASFHMISITLTSMSLVDLSWFTISGDVCVPYLTLGQFFWYGYTSDVTSTAEYDCINNTIVNMMRITILLCFMSIIFSLIGFFLDIIESKSKTYQMIRRYAFCGTCSVIWNLLIICISYYIILLIQDSLEEKYPKVDSSVTYGDGFYILVFGGVTSLFGVFYTLILTKNLNHYARDDDPCLIDDFDDTLDSFNNLTPPPPYSLPPPPYTP